MGLENVPRCQHVKVNGTQCGSPALRRRRRCYFHEGVRIERAKFVADQFAQRRFDLPPLEDANSVQVALMKVIQWLAYGRMDAKTAGLTLYALQTASCNLRHTRFEAEKVTDVIIDRNTLDQTCINGPQWFARDFADQAEPGQERVATAPSGQPVTGEAAPAQVGTVPVRPRSRAGAKRKWPERAEIEQPPSLVRDLAYELFSDPLRAVDSVARE